ncbi:hypothetical protein B0H10DRAFT_2427095 [Mycena sp. CBHHK59/15]|nr:hypothetical protein B0H10DRAFT_2427095 [Mycena sp. CBHHK59/15]
MFIAAALNQAPQGSPSATTLCLRRIAGSPSWVLEYIPAALVNLSTHVTVLWIHSPIVSLKLLTYFFSSRHHNPTDSGTAQGPRSSTLRVSIWQLRLHTRESRRREGGPTACGPLGTAQVPSVQGNTAITRLWASPSLLAAFQREGQPADARSPRTKGPKGGIRGCARVFRVRATRICLPTAEMLDTVDPSREMIGWSVGYNTSDWYQPAGPPTSTN